MAGAALRFEGEGTSRGVDAVVVGGGPAGAERLDPNNAIAKDLIAQKLITKDEIATFEQNSSPAWRDEIWMDAAIDILTKHTPNVLLFHLVETDTLRHEYGPLTPAAYAPLPGRGSRWL
jgi:predicted AlkP superfamily pyrophosphatase or phosphodiesterase